MDTPCRYSTCQGRKEFLPRSLLFAKGETLRNGKSSRQHVSRRGPDAVTEELVTVLSGEGCHEFKPLFTLVYTKLRARKMVSGGEEMLRLRVYEKLQQLVNQGMVSKVITEGIKEYAGLATLAAPRPLLAITKAIAV